MRHMGYSIINNKNRLLTSIFSKEELNGMPASLDATYPINAPHRVVRVLIDEIEDERQESNQA